MKYRQKMNYKRSKRQFTKSAGHVNGKNRSRSPMRGGYRL